MTRYNSFLSSYEFQTDSRSRCKLADLSIQRVHNLSTYCWTVNSHTGSQHHSTAATGKFQTAYANSTRVWDNYAVQANIQCWIKLHFLNTKHSYIYYYNSENSVNHKRRTTYSFPINTKQKMLVTMKSLSFVSSLFNISEKLTYSNNTLKRNSVIFDLNILLIRNGQYTCTEPYPKQCCYIIQKPCTIIIKENGM